MKRLVVCILLLSFLFIAIWLAENCLYQKKVGSIEAKKDIQQTQLTKKQLPTLTQTDVSFITKRDKVLETIIKSPLYFSVKTQKFSVNRWTITIKLEGEIKGAADAADLRLELPENLTVSNIKVGPAFPFYPRKVAVNNYLLISGVASADNNQMVFGEPNKIFAELTVQTINNQLDIKKIVVDKNDTKIYLNGESILDINKSIKIIDLP